MPKKCFKCGAFLFFLFCSNKQPSHAILHAIPLVFIKFEQKN